MSYVGRRPLPYGELRRPDRSSRTRVGRRVPGAFWNVRALSKGRTSSTPSTSSANTTMLRSFCCAGERMRGKARGADARRRSASFTAGAPRIGDAVALGDSGRVVMSALRRLASLVFALGVAGAACNGTTGDEAHLVLGLREGLATADAATSPSRPMTRAVSARTASPSFARRCTWGRSTSTSSPPSTGFDTPACITPDIYAAQVPGGLEVNLLDTSPQAFSAPGNGSADNALSWDLWLTNGDIDGPDDLDGVHIIFRSRSHGCRHAQISDNARSSLSGGHRHHQPGDGRRGRCAPHADDERQPPRPVPDLQAAHSGDRARVASVVLRGGTLLDVTIDPTARLPVQRPASISGASTRKTAPIASSTRTRTRRTRTASRAA